MEEIEFRDFSFAYPGCDEYVLKQISLTVHPSEFIVICGKSGCGKSTLLSIIGMMETCDTNGVYRFLGEDVMMMTERQKAICRRKKMGFVFQDFNLVSDLSCLDNVEMTMGYDGVPEIIRRKRALELLEQVGMRGKETHEPYQLSGGQQQRVSIGRALINSPTVILADEPTGNLDSKNSQEIMNLLRLSNEKYHQTLIIITHDEEIANQAKHLIRIEDGRICRDEVIS